MNDDPSEVNVIYVKVRADHVLQELMDNVANFFDKEGKYPTNFGKILGIFSKNFG